MKIERATLQEQNKSQQSELAAFKEHSGVSRQEQLVKIASLSSQVESLQRGLADKGVLLFDLDNCKKKIEYLEGQYFESEKVRRQLHNTIQELKGNVRVMARVRPFLSFENEESKEGTPIACLDDTNVEIKGVGSKGDEKQSFVFDHVWDSYVKQEHVFDEVSQLVQSALDGYNVCLFAYGQTGSGKTYTMQGSMEEEHQGIIPRAINKVMEACELKKQEGWLFTMKVTFLEIYNENVKDLLKPKSDQQFTITRDSDGRTLVRGLHYQSVSLVEEIGDLMATAMKHRSVSSTLMNEHSSRSHSVFTLHLEGTNQSRGVMLKGALNLCDLAGSERVKKSGAEGVRLTEAASINKSLSALSNVFMKIGSSSAHIPFRDSKLTYLLQVYSNIYIYILFLFM